MLSSSMQVFELLQLHLQKQYFVFQFLIHCKYKPNNNLYILQE